MLLLSESDVEEALTIDSVIETVMSAYRDYSEELVDVPSRVTMQVRGESNSAIFLTANYYSMPFYGIKKPSRFPSNIGEKHCFIRHSYLFGRYR
jgi:ornithine cyclodeaminase/alanine dehydrogenase-like protein (mu-crystallin family)